MPAERRSQALTVEQHRDRHVELHRALDELDADFMAHAKGAASRLPSSTSIADLAAWSHLQTQRPEDHTALFGHRGLAHAHDLVEVAAAAIANARGMRHGVPEIKNVLDLLPARLRNEVIEDATAALNAVGLSGNGVPRDGQRS